MIVILNPDAGTNGNRRTIEDEVRESFAKAGVEVSIQQPDASADLIALARAAVAGPGELIVAGGGDGTISAVASVLAGSDKTLGVLPRGTLNHFAKDLQIPLDLPEAIETILRGRVLKVDLGEVNGRLFINNSSLGLYPRIVADREAQQQRLARGKWSAFLWATLRAFRRFPFLNLKITVEGERLNRRTAFLFVGNNEYEIAGFELGARHGLTSGKLGLYLAHRTGRFGLVRLAFRALFGRLEAAKDFDIYSVEDARIEARSPRLHVATDGELTLLETPLVYRIRPGALRVMVPKATEEKS